MFYVFFLSLSIRNSVPHSGHSISTCRRSELNAFIEQKQDCSPWLSSQTTRIWSLTMFVTQARSLVLFLDLVNPSHSNKEDTGNQTAKEESTFVKFIPSGISEM